MFRDQTVVALITARGGSKGIPRKNLVELIGKPLISYSITAALGSACVDRTFVSSDDQEILTVSRQCGAEVIERPSELARDDSTSDSVIKHALEYLAEQKVGVDYLVLLQPTSPQRNAEDIDAAFTLLNSSKRYNLISVFEPEHHPLKAYLLNDDGCLHGIVSDRSSFRRRQDLPRAYMPNGAIYIFTAKAFRQNNGIPLEYAIPYVMSIRRSVDVDTPQDLEIIRSLMESTP
ncbi:cytidylyltransferase domain-containing protein [Motiliproteus sp. MSK22-1]|uniref:acylneuraminate cytidylyltransferase family protein n=1 Tax=Motiliproteus sp. MSK22-1 TaxID=1897630 RepID=UPI0009758C90|nr:acylneuraminate cytidylyltransferase family protein [Motiliproteus sp. MSK22-1]OMH30016.1 hypothetical protein BGP75_18985 [Motiliproteus sp. MSK22-1]